MHVCSKNKVPSFSDSNIIAWTDTVRQDMSYNLSVYPGNNLKQNDISTFRSKKFTFENLTNSINMTLDSFVYTVYERMSNYRSLSV